MVGGKLSVAYGSKGTTSEAFIKTFGHITFQWGNCPECGNYGGYTTPRGKLIKFKSMSGDHNDNIFERKVKNVIHELGHAFDWSFAASASDWDHRPSASMSQSLIKQRDLFLRPNSPDGYIDWQQHPSNIDANGKTGSETFADMFIAWVYDAWNEENPDIVDQAQNWASPWMPN